MKALSTLTALFAASAALYQNVLLVGAASKEGETVTIGDYVFEIDTNSSVTAGRTAVNLSGSSAAAASLVLTLSGNAVADETVTIAGVVYTWKASVTTTANQVKVGATAAESIDNLVAAVTAAAGSGTLYGSATVVNPYMTAVRSSSTLVATALVKGTAGNAYVMGETMTNGAWAGGAVIPAGGVDPTAAQTIAALVTAINATIPKVKATAITGGLQILDSAGRGAKATTETLTGSGNVWLAATTYGVDTGGSIPNLGIVVQRAVNALEDANKVMVFGFPETPVAFSVQARGSTGIIKAIDGKCVIVGNSIVIYSDAGTDLVENDVVCLTVAV